ncbi:MAG: hypothetical protein ABSF84_16555 [Acidimicrobiales bacterium]|jgi:hypothetical protein
MSTVSATAVGIAVLAAAGLLPVLATVGLRWFAVPLVPLAGAVVSGVAATAYLSVGGSFMAWFLVLAAAGAAAVAAVWASRPATRPWARRSAPAGSGGRRWSRPRMVGAVGFVAVVASCAFCLRGLHTPTVGFDARALWVMRPGWFLEGHAQLLIDMKVRGLVLTQSAYPPLVSSSAAVAWRVTGIHTARLGVTTVAVLDACALAAAALALVECGRGVAARLAGGGVVGTGTEPGSPPWAPMVAAVVGAVALVFVAAGITEPFLTNGYADPIWSLAAVGAVAFGLQTQCDRSTRAATVVLILVAGLAKDEGYATAVALVALVAARSIGTAGLRDGRRWVAPVALAAGELAVLAWWPILMHAIGARGATTSFTLSDDIASRTSAVARGMSPYLHVLVVALPLSVVGGAVLSALRRAGGVGNDLWAWLALALGLTALGGALVTGSGAIEPWILSTVHRITEYPALEGWWIVAFWAVVAASGVRRPGPAR